MSGIFDLLFGGDPGGENSPSDIRAARRRGFTPGAASNPYLTNPQSGAGVMSDPNALTPPTATNFNAGVASNPWLSGQGPQQGGYGDGPAQGFQPPPFRSPPVPPVRPPGIGMGQPPMPPPRPADLGGSPSISPAGFGSGYRPEGNDLSGWNSVGTDPLSASAGAAQGGAGTGVSNPLAGNGAANFFNRVVSPTSGFHVRPNSLIGALQNGVNGNGNGVISQLIRMFR